MFTDICWIQDTKVKSVSIFGEIVFLEIHYERNSVSSFINKSKFPTILYLLK